MQISFKKREVFMTQLSVFRLYWAFSFFHVLLFLFKKHLWQISINHNDPCLSAWACPPDSVALQVIVYAIAGVYVIFDDINNLPPLTPASRPENRQRFRQQATLVHRP